MSDSNVAESLLSPELAAQLGPNAVIDPDEQKNSKKKKKKSKTDPRHLPKRLQPKSKSKTKTKKLAKKLASLARRKKSKELRGSLYESLQATRLSATQSALISSSGDLTKKQSHRARVNEAFLHSKAGLAHDAEVLQRRSHAAQQAIDAEEDAKLQLALDAQAKAALQASLEPDFGLSFKVASRRPTKKRRVQLLPGAEAVTTKEADNKKEESSSSSSSSSDEDEKEEEEEDNPAQSEADEPVPDEPVPDEPVPDEPMSAAGEDDDDEVEESSDDMYGGSDEEDAVVVETLSLREPGSDSDDSYIPSTANKSGVPTPRLHLELKPWMQLARDPVIQEGRMKLPICAQEQEIMEAVSLHDTLIICGETGSGKTTQLPQFLYEAGYSFAEAGKPGMIGVTEPRRVAAISTAARVATEMALPSPAVAHQVRFDSESTAETKIKFMTDGILLREVQDDFLLRRYSAIILDEAHERGLNTDILLGLLSKIIPMRRRLFEAKQNNVVSPLKLIIMSATLRLADFVENKALFPDKLPKVIEVASRQYPVTTHFSRATALETGDWHKEILRKVITIHKTLPPGGILVFLTGRQEIEMLAGKLQKALSTQPKQSDKDDPMRDDYDENNDDGVDKDDADELMEPSRRHQFVPEDDLELEGHDHLNGDQDEDAKLNELLRRPCSTPAVVLPLYAMLSGSRQMEVFTQARECAAQQAKHKEANTDDKTSSTMTQPTRLIVLATNIAETSLTIPSIRYVVDCGREKKKLYDAQTGVSKFEVGWISQAAAAQRSGRAGRVSEGHAYRLYSSAVFQNQFPVHGEPEILQSPIESVVLLMKKMSVQNILSFPFPSPPRQTDIALALNSLKQLEALDADDHITAIGKTLLSFPLSPRHAKMLVLANQHALLPYVIALVAALSVETLFVPSGAGDEQKKAVHGKKSSLERAQATWQDADSDLLSRLNLIGGYHHVATSEKREKIRETLSARPDNARQLWIQLRKVESDLTRKVDKFCADNMVRPKAVKEVQALRQQLSVICWRLLRGATSSSDNKSTGKERIPDQLNVRLPMAVVSHDQRRLLRQILASGFIDQVARKLTYDEIEGLKRSGREDVAALKSLEGAYVCMAVDTPVFIHPTSVLWPTQNQPEFLVYHQMMRSATTGRYYMQNVTRVESSWLASFGGALVFRSKPLLTPLPAYDARQDKVTCHVRPTFGAKRWRLPPERVPFPLDNTDIYRHFARLVLNGQVCLELLPFRPFLSANPDATLSGNAALSSKRAMAIVAKLESHKACSKADLYRLWAVDPKFLRKEMLAWLSAAKHTEFKQVWVKMTNSK